MAMVARQDGWQDNRTLSASRCHVGVHSQVIIKYMWYKDLQGNFKTSGKQTMQARPDSRYVHSVAVFLTLSWFVIFTGLSFASEVLQSGPQRVHVLELYTSEGCSSCPPADRWLSELKEDERLWREFIPIAFHVDYWNDIGWQDRFSSPAYSERQRNYARSKGLSTVYTPGFLLNGREWRSYFGLRKLALDPGSAAGNLTVTLEQQTVQATYQAGGQAPTRPLLNIAVLGFDLITRVDAGENRGKQLRHDFTVLGYKTATLSVTEEGYINTTQRPGVTIHAPRSGIAVWINDEGDLTPLQATGGWIMR